MSSKTKRWLVQSAIGQDGRGAPQSVSDAYVTGVLIIPQRRRNHGLLLRVLSQRNNFGRVAAPSWERKGIWAKFQQICTVTFKSTSGGEAKRWKAQRSPFPGLRHWHPWTWKNQQNGSRGENHPSGLAATPHTPQSLSVHFNKLWRAGSQGPLASMRQIDSRFSPWARSQYACNNNCWRGAVVLCQWRSEAPPPRTSSPRGIHIWE